MDRSFLLTLTLICIVVAGVGGQSPTAAPASLPVELPKSPSPVPESSTPVPATKASSPVSSPPIPAPVIDTPPAPVAAPEADSPPAPAPSKHKKTAEKLKNAPAPAPQLLGPSAESSGPNSDAFSPGPSTSADDQSGAESTRALWNVVVGAIAISWSLLVMPF